uniref:Uncharacterized protein n=1 Tax=Candidatus Methanophaga sp. ANME-1 ERB7 TaxID=2759913 RepID=A0A7G9Z2F6_9EURY|nr:hypothetical protein IPKNHHKO_00015 [Methanosarcinales archaeon ANME-1 ERB7]
MSFRKKTGQPGNFRVQKRERAARFLTMVVPPLIDSASCAGNVVSNMLERVRTKRHERNASLTPLELAQYRFTCAVKSGTTSIHEGVATLMREIGADEATIYLRRDGNGPLEHYLTTDGSQASARKRWQ